MKPEEQQSRSSRLLDELCAFLFTTLRFPRTEIPCAGHTALAARERLPPLSPGGLTALMLGISLSLMLSGSITFMIGFMMMPWVLGMVMLLYFIGLFSIISMLWKVVLRLSSSPSPSRSFLKGISGAFL
ncbi:hypothetical protein MA16_Dca000489 [Dendrobium catenatum]|uniref:Uncharacterized protein n=1 Tax=Dendrobium catenatum TaxID=906689 RepID=A0A2I0WU05_9ASPA|nr:hypothetical protein MA16_Dca000489 [Dendrobium catenatum]